MATQLERIEYVGFPGVGQDPLIIVTISSLAFQSQADESTFIENVRDLVEAQQNITVVTVTKHEKVSTAI